jgi:hypothetical protein
MISLITKPFRNKKYHKNDDLALETKYNVLTFQLAKCRG